jgi:rubredoxin
MNEISVLIGRARVMDKYRCTVCGYIYDPEKGDETQNVAPGTPFDKLPDSWLCPECGVGKDLFEKVG